MHRKVVTLQQPVSESWWLSGGISAAIAAAVYQPKGAASYAASLVNLTGNATFNATEGVTPGWDATNGWMFDGTDDYLNSNVNGNGTNKQYSVLIKYTNLSLGSGDIFGQYAADTNSFRISSVNANSMHCYNSGYYLWTHNAQGVTPTDGVIGIAGDRLYYNASDKGTFPSGSNLADLSFYIGTKNSNANPVVIYIQALAIYSAPITPEQVTAVTAAMGVL